MYVPPGPGELPKFGLRAWTALVAFIGVFLVKFSVELFQFLPKLENTSTSTIEHLQDRAQVQRDLAIAGVVIGLAANLMAWRKARRAPAVLCGVSVALLSAAVLVFAVSF